MFRTLPIRLRILALLGIAAIGFVLALSVTLLFGQLAQSQLTQIERGYAPSLATRQALVDALGPLQRALRDAVAVSDTAQVSAACATRSMPAPLVTASDIAFQTNLLALNQRVVLSTPVE